MLDLICLLPSCIVNTDDAEVPEEDRQYLRFYDPFIYRERYQAQGESVTLVGANFDSRTRTIEEWKSEPEMRLGT